ncbi:MAG TPA: branched-chain amino acid ABC transporter permease, partial [Reyranella sp.]|nr:branched-chain amino acid ABC transporter permease [Reyranella sp.]
MNLTQQILNGLVLGSGYALIAIGWTVLLGAARLVNFAHGQLYMLGAFVAWLVMQRLGVSYFVAVPVAVLALSLLGIVLQGMMLRLVMQQNLTSLMIVTLGFGYLIQGVAPALFGADPQAFKSPLASANLRFGEIWFTWQDVAIILGTLLLFAVLWLVLNRTRVGALVRSVAEDPKLAQLFGINATLVYIGVFV